MPFYRYMALNRWPILLISALFACADPPQQGTGEIAVDQILGAEPDSGFAHALEPRRFSFPQDHGPHPEFKQER